MRTTPELAPLSKRPHYILGEVMQFDRFNVDRSLYTQDIQWRQDSITPAFSWGCGSPVVKVPDHGRHVMTSRPVPLKTRRVGKRCTLNLSGAETSSRGASSGVVLIT
ncbi:hypothetical protein TNCV_2360931 [Trichonephila clavipes]|nr:hypothetical protein TNCV_2360931 [Trichonephila clavipes]